MNRRSIKRIREKLSLTQEEFGRKVGVTGRTVSRWETGKGAPRGRSKEIISDLDGCSLVKTLDELEEMLNKVAQAKNDENRFGQSRYLEGVRAALDWACGNTNHSPLDD